jgi:hypothetical protein
MIKRNIRMYNYPNMIYIPSSNYSTFWRCALIFRSAFMATHAQEQFQHTQAVPCPSSNTPRACHVPVPTHPGPAMSQFQHTQAVPCPSSNTPRSCHLPVPTHPGPAMSQFQHTQGVPCFSSNTPRSCHVPVPTHPGPAMSQFQHTQGAPCPSSNTPRSCHVPVPTHPGHAISQAISRQPVKAKDRDASQTSTCGISGGQSDAGIGFSLSTSVFPPVKITHHSTNAPFSSASTCCSFGNREALDSNVLSRF